MLMPTPYDHHNVTINKISYGFFLLTDMQTTPTTPQKWPHQKVIVNGAQCSESNGNVNEKIFRFLFFELSSKIGVIFSEKWH